MIFCPVNRTAHVEIVETEHDWIGADALNVGSRIRDPVLQSPIEQVEIRADIADELAVARNGQAIGPDAKCRVILHRCPVIVAAEIKIEAIADIDL